MALQSLLKIVGCFGKLKAVTPKNIVFITGCDSGLGYTLAMFCHKLNMTVVSGCHSINSEGAKMLRNVSESQRMKVIEIDLLKQESIVESHRMIQELIKSNAYVFTALVNNAGVMCMGEFEWQTTDLFESQINVNLLGTMRVTKEFLPLIRQHHGRIINVTSHCGLQSLPGLAPYAASKAALRFFNDSLRIEMTKYGVEVINFIPGSFVMSSNICARQQEQALQMEKSFSDEQRGFYGEYFNDYNGYLRFISGFKQPNQLDDKPLLEKFKDALTNSHPRAMYIHEPMRYRIYRLLFSICPTPIVDWLTVKFCSMPIYRPNKKLH